MTRTETRQGASADLPVRQRDLSLAARCNTTSAPPALQTVLQATGLNRAPWARDYLASQVAQAGTAVQAHICQALRSDRAPPFRGKQGGVREGHEAGGDRRKHSCPAWLAPRGAQTSGCRRGRNDATPAYSSWALGPHVRRSADPQPQLTHARSRQQSPRRRPAPATVVKPARRSAARHGGQLARPAATTPSGMRAAKAKRVAADLRQVDPAELGFLTMRAATRQEKGAV